MFKSYILGFFIGLFCLPVVHANDAGCERIIADLHNESIDWFSKSKLSDGRLTIALLKQSSEFKEFVIWFLKNNLEIIYGIEPADQKDDSAELMMKIMSRMGQFKSKEVRRQFIIVLNELLLAVEQHYINLSLNRSTKNELWTKDQDPLYLDLFKKAATEVFSEINLKNLQGILSGESTQVTIETRDIIPASQIPRKILAPSNLSEFLGVQIPKDWLPAILQNREQLIERLEKSPTLRAWIQKRLQETKLGGADQSAVDLYLDLMRAFENLSSPEQRRLKDAEFFAQVLTAHDNFMGQEFNAVADTQFFKALSVSELGNKLFGNHAEPALIIRGLVMPSGRMVMDASGSKGFTSVKFVSRDIYENSRNPKSKHAESLVVEGDDISLRGLVFILRLQDLILKYEKSYSNLVDLYKPRWNSALIKNAKTEIQSWLQDVKSNKEESKSDFETAVQWNNADQISEAEVYQLSIKSEPFETLRIKLANKFTLEFAESFIAIMNILNEFWPTYSHGSQMKPIEINDLRKVRDILIDRVEGAMIQLTTHQQISARLNLLDAHHRAAFERARIKAWEIHNTLF